MYFPENSDSTWETTPVSGLDWNQAAIPSLEEFLKAKNTQAFLILVNGRIVMETYFDGHSAAGDWEWNSAGKTLLSATVGIARQQGLLRLDDRVSDYLGTGWTNMPDGKESLITIGHLLTMTSGIDDTKQLVRKRNLTYVADAGTRWAYGNVFQKLMDVVAAASGKPFATYFDQSVKERIGMDGYWNEGLIFTIYHSTARSMARFGLLALNKGSWKNMQIIDESFFTESITPSQPINPSYGYFWWLNGQEAYMLPNDRTVYPGPLVPNAPPDMYAAMGARDQRIYVVPGKNMVIVRMGHTADPLHPDFAASGFDNQFWGKINAVIGQ